MFLGRVCYNLSSVALIHFTAIPFKNASCFYENKYKSCLGSWLWNIYLSWYNWFLQFLYYRRRNKWLRETFLSMVSCGALERSNNPYVDSTVKGIFVRWVWFERKSWKRAEAIEKRICEPKAKFVDMCVRKKQQQFSRYMKNVISHSKRISNLQNFLPKHPFPLL